jgi:YEATS domain-containing protein 4
VVKLYFQPIASEKQQQLSHFLQLEPYGDEEMMAQQRAVNLVKSEIVEFIEFNEPTEGFWDVLTSEDQWGKEPRSDPRSRGAKGKAKSANPPIEKRTVELLDSPEQQGTVYSRETEEALLETLNKAMKKCEEETAEVLKKSKEINDQLIKVKEGTDIDAKLIELHEKIPPKKK